MAKPKQPKTRRKRDLIERQEKPGHTPNDAESKKALAATKWGDTYLTDFLDRSEKNMRISYVKLKGYFEMLESLGELFKKAVESVGYSDESSLAIASLLGRACGNFFAAVRLSSSGQLAECYAQLRVCIENALYAFNIQNDPHLAQVWFNRHRSNKLRMKSINLFKPGIILRELKQRSRSVGRETANDYEGCIDFGAHPNERSVTFNLKFSKTDRISLELLNTEKGVFQACLLACIMCGLDVIRVFNLIFREEFKGINADERLRNIQRQFSRIAPGPIYDLRSNLS